MFSGVSNWFILILNSKKSGKSFAVESDVVSAPPDLLFLWTMITWIIKGDVSVITTPASSVMMLSAERHHWESNSSPDSPGQRGREIHRRESKERKLKPREQEGPSMCESTVILENDYQTGIHYSTGQSGRAQSVHLCEHHKSDLSVLITLKSPSHTRAILGEYYCV